MLACLDASSAEVLAMEQARSGPAFIASLLQVPEWRRGLAAEAAEAVAALVRAGASLAGALTTALYDVPHAGYAPRLQILGEACLAAGRGLELVAGLESKESLEILALHGGSALSVLRRCGAVIGPHATKLAASLEDEALKWEGLGAPRDGALYRRGLAVLRRWHAAELAEARMLAATMAKRMPEALALHVAGFALADAPKPAQANP